MRNKNKIVFSKNLVYEIPIRKVKSQKKLKKYYDEVYMKFDPLIRQKTLPFERNDMDIIRKVKKNEGIPIKVYR